MSEDRNEYHNKVSSTVLCDEAWKLYYAWMKAVVTEEFTGTVGESEPLWQAYKEHRRTCPNCKEVME